MFGYSHSDYQTFDVESTCSFFSPSKSIMNATAKLLLINVRCPRNSYDRIMRFSFEFWFYNYGHKKNSESLTFSLESCIHPEIWRTGLTEIELFNSFSFPTGLEGTTINWTTMFLHKYSIYLKRNSKASLQSSVSWPTLFQTRQSSPRRVLNAP